VVGLALTALDPALGARLEPAIEGLVSAMPDVDFCLLPLSRHPYVAAHNDAVFARALQARSPRLRILPPLDDPSRVLAIFDGLSAAVCVRYHSLLFAERAGIPIVALPYAEKCRHWLAERSIEPAEPEAEVLVELLRGRLLRAAA
jgi:polysaccharide pyruvyl transferase WcaK-like protein